jgi:hypothetical protein
VNTQTTIADYIRENDMGKVFCVNSVSYGNIAVYVKRSLMKAKEEGC